MDLQKTLLYGAAVILGFLLWTQWVKEHAQAPTAQPAKSTDTSIITAAEEIPPSNVSSTKPMSEPTVNISQPVPSKKELITVQTDVLNVEIDTRGGHIVQAALNKYPQTQQSKQQPFLLLQSTPEKRYIAQSGLVSKDGPDLKRQAAKYQTAQKNYRLAGDQDQLQVDLVWRNTQGLRVIKRFTFQRGNYRVGVDYVIKNNGSHAWTGYMYQQLLQHYTKHKKRSLLNITGYQGGAISSTSDAYKKIGFTKMQRENLSEKTTGGWAAMQQHYFLSAWIPAQKTMHQYYSRYYPTTETYAIGMVSPQITVPAGGELQTGAKLYIGPELMDQLEAAAPNLELTIDYGWLWFISLAIFWLMKHIYQVVGNWGWAIVLVTAAIKLLFYKLSEKSYKSMAALRKLSPRIQTLKERFGDDRQGFSRAMMELYKKEKVNPFGGCLPIVVQIPVFIALYYVLLESVQLRHAPFMLWIQDLSVRDPYFILPLLVGGLLFIQQRLNPPPPDPMQAKVMMFMPVLFTGLFLYLPAGLALYMFINNGLSILQQWYITRRFGEKKPQPSQA